MSIAICISILAIVVLAVFYKKALRAAYSSCRTLQGVAVRQVWSIKNYTDLAADGEAREYAQVQQIYLNEIKDPEIIRASGYGVFCDLQEENQIRLQALKRNAEEIVMPDIPSRASIHEINSLIREYEKIIGNLEVIEKTRRILTKSYHENNKQMIDLLHDLRKENSNK